MDFRRAQVLHFPRLNKPKTLSTGSKNNGFANPFRQDDFTRSLASPTSSEDNEDESDEDYEEREGSKNDEDYEENEENKNDEDYKDSEDSQDYKNYEEDEEDEEDKTGRNSALGDREFDPYSVVATHQLPPRSQLAASATPTLAVYNQLEVGYRTSKPTQPKSEPDGAKSSSPLQNVAKTRITISDNLSTDDDKKNRRLLVLKPKKPKPTSTSNPSTPDNPLPDKNSRKNLYNDGPNHLQDYQMQLMLLEQQNKSRILRARQEEEKAMFGGSENHAPTTADFDRGRNSPNPSDKMKRGSLYMNNAEMPSPQEEGSIIHLFSALGIDPIALGIPSESLGNVEALREYLSQTQGTATTFEGKTRAKEPSRYLVLHRINKGKQMYFDPPEWVVGQDHTRILQSRLPLSNLPDYLEKHTEISFIVFRDYTDSDIPTSKETTAAAADKDTGIMKSPVHKEEKLLAVSEHLTEAIKVILISKPEFADMLTWFEKAGPELPSPYTFIYHSRAVIQRLTEDTSETSASRQLKLMIDYIYEHYGAEYNAADALFKKSCVTVPYVKYLFKPGDVLVKGTGADVNGYLLTTWLQSTAWIEVSPKEARKNKTRSDWNMNVCSWSFDGAFRRVNALLKLTIDGTDETEYAIKDLNIRPVEYASGEDRNILQSRGQMFWKCRERHFVSYQERGRGDLHSASEERFMIDMETFRELHPGDKKKIVIEYLPSEALDDDAIAQDNPPDPNFVYLLPQKIIGYNMRRKKWVELHADWLSEVVWDKKAFKKLVLAQKTKDLIEALIVNQIAAEKSTDLISGKGNGLILLLHGGPGTGKTLTAESVAEIAEKPLYRVTCGDIGSEPDEVEQYLNSVLDLGKAWSCVVLLDEADVFLEERSMSDIKRNALVSIFLRVLEYHDGIIILTSNRVGTFDEAFKSRIQLALHYPSLTKGKRYEIWTIFITRLRELEETQVDFSDLEDHRWELADYKLNGRQIRNAIQTSRQYVSWKNAKEKTILNFEILKEIIKISGEFDVYIDKLNNGMTPDQLAEDDGLRLADAQE